MTHRQQGQQALLADVSDGVREHARQLGAVRRQELCLSQQHTAGHDVRAHLHVLCSAKNLSL